MYKNCRQGCLYDLGFRPEGTPNPTLKECQSVMSNMAVVESRLISVRRTFTSNFSSRSGFPTFFYRAEVRFTAGNDSLPVLQHGRFNNGVSMV